MPTTRWRAWVAASLLVATLLFAPYGSRSETFARPPDARVALRQRDAPASAPLPSLTAEQVLTQTQERACRFFWEQSNADTGLTNDRANNGTGAKPAESNYKVASIAATGYALAALPLAVEHKWRSRDEAYNRALVTLRFVRDKMHSEHGWYYHFIDRATGQRVWNCELSSIDTTLLTTGALLAGQYWKGTEVDRLANELYDRMDWTWMRTNGGARPDKTLVSMGWNPEHGFLAADWGHYCELMELYLLGLGSRTAPLPDAAWTDWKRNAVEYKGHTTLEGGPIFLHEMAQSFYNFHDQRDRLGWNYYNTAREGVRINRQYCLDNRDKRKTYDTDVWGLNACDYPDGYKAFAAPGDEDGTVSPTGAIAALLFEPKLAREAGKTMYTRYGGKIWGRYGFADAFNVDRDWYDADVIGIDLGMALLAVEDARTGLPWKLLTSHARLKIAWKRAGFHAARGPELQVSPTVSGAQAANTRTFAH